jgi:hypothetical protein
MILRGYGATLGRLNCYVFSYAIGNSCLNHSKKFATPRSYTRISPNSSLIHFSWTALLKREAIFLVRNVYELHWTDHSRHRTRGEEDWSNKGSLKCISRAANGFDTGATSAGIRHERFGYERIRGNHYLGSI